MYSTVQTFVRAPGLVCVCTHCVGVFVLTLVVVCCWKRPLLPGTNTDAYYLYSLGLAGALRLSGRQQLFIV